MQGDTTARTQRMGMAGAGFEPVAERFAVGKICSYAAYSNVVPGTAYVPTFNLTSVPPAGTFSAIVRQAPTTAAAAEPMHTMFRHNGRNAAGPPNQTYGPRRGSTSRHGDGPVRVVRHRLNRPL